jgi:Putative peptidoglycan binding domain
MRQTGMVRWVGWVALSVAAATLVGPAYAGDRTVRSGPVYSSVRAIEWAQRVLQGNDLLAPGTYTPGRNDRATLKAIRAFQREHYLRPTGMLDPETVGMLTSHARDMAAGPAPVAESGEGKTAEPGVVPDESVALSAAISEPAGTAPAAPAAPAAAAAPATEAPRAARTMPATGSPITTLAVLGGLLLLAGGMLLWRGRV